MMPEKREQIEAVIARQAAEGQPISHAAVYAEVRGNRTQFTTYMRTWRAEQREAGAVAVLEDCPPDADAASQDAPDPAEAPAVVRATRTQEPHVVALARAYTEAQRALEAAQRRVEEVSIAMARAQWTARTALERLRHASRVVWACDPHEGQAACRAAAAQQGLATFVGAEEAARAASDRGYVPRGL